MTQEACSHTALFSGIMLIVFGLIVLVAGRMKFTPYLFMILGVSIAIGVLLGEFAWIVCIMLVILGIICAVKFEERMLLGRP